MCGTHVIWGRYDKLHDSHKKIFAVMTQRSSAWPSVLPSNQLILLFLQVCPKI